jgi:outer membrane protein OmpA-like peptidoglycan-associated protein
MNEFSKKDITGKYELSYLGRAFFRLELIEGLQGELGGGYGLYAGKDYVDGKYETEIIPIDFRFVVNPFDMESWNPYFYIGAGSMRYVVKEEPLSVSKYPVEREGWEVFYPLGFGSQFRITDNVMLEATLGMAFTITENLNYFNKFNSWEDAYLNLGVGLTFGPTPNDDKDMDGLFRLDEERLGTDPFNPDSDGDGLNDFEEVNKYRSNPLNSDSDGDGLTDGMEVTSTLTDLLNSDTDGDQLNDGEEVNTHKTDPTKMDTDNDKLNDNEELNTYKTDPLKADSDADGLNDGVEVTAYKTNPLQADSDGDTLSDGDEINKHKTDPLNTDSDAGTVDDATEIGRGTNPLNAEDDVVKVGVPIVLEGITFASGKADITPESETTLQGALRTLQTYPEIAVEIGGHTDNVGSSSSNKKLSQKRAEAVMKWLISNGIEATRLTAVGYGEDQPMVDNDTPENRQKNRRIEFKRVQ